MARGLRPFTGDGAGEPVLNADNGEELFHVQAGVSIVLEDRAPESPGTLYVSTYQIIWLSDVDRNKGYAVDFLSVSLHAVSRDPESYPFPCMYIQMETGDESSGPDVVEEHEGTFDISKVKEMRLIPSDPDQLDNLFKIFCECAELNPEPSSDEEGGGGEGRHNWVFNDIQMEAAAGDEDDDSDWQTSVNPASAIGHSNGVHELASNVLQLQIDDQRFEDAEEMEEHDESTTARHQ